MQRDENATDGPDIDLGVVVLLEEDEFGRTVPARHHVLRQLPLHAGGTVTPHARASHITLGVETVDGSYLRFLLLLVLQIHLASETEVDDLQLALGVDEDVGGLQVAMHDVRALHVQKTAEQLIDDELDVVRSPPRNSLGVPDNAREIPASILLDRPQTSERVWIWRNEDIAGMKSTKCTYSNLLILGWLH